MSADSVETFIARWQAAGGSERANYQLFITELCELLGLPKPEPAVAEAEGNAYVFERRVTFRHGDGSSSSGYIDCYRRAAFILEAKQTRLAEAQGRVFDDALLRARGQAENYARALPAEEGRPPFLIVVDVGNVIELYAEFTRSGATYVPFPDPRSHRIRLADLRDPAVRARLAAVWLDPLALDPTRHSARVTRELAAHLAELAKSLEASGHAAESVAGFLTRCLFSMFAEDVGLIPRASFTELLKSLAGEPAQFVPLVGALWQEMDSGGFSVVLRRTLPRFNGKLFKSPEVLPLAKQQIALLLEASKADWTQVEPAIFGTLLERALDQHERHALGAHYTPRAYVDRLVQPTVIEPLRQSWAYVQGAAVLLANEGKQKEALAELRAFHHRLCSLRVLDPACGSGNFLYVALEHLKRLEGEVLNQIHDLGETQSLLEAEGLTVDPHQFLGLELNPRAAAIAELVLWIGYLQWHFRTQGSGLPPSPILKDFRNIECRDAVLAWDDVLPVFDAHGIPVSRWDGRTTRKHPVTGEDVPDEAARAPLMRYLNPRPAEWPQADVVVGNPPFIGNKRMRTALGDGYVDALRGAWPAVPESADFVMFWWQRAAQLVAQGRLARFGFITTNSLTQAFNRRVVQGALDAGLHLAFAVPDHPWVDNADGAAVRIAMTVGAPGAGEGRLCSVTAEREGKGEGLEVELAESRGKIHADLKVGADVTAAQALQATSGLSYRGMIPHGEGFLVAPDEGTALDGGALLRPYRNGKDLTDRPRGVLVIDTFGLTEAELRQRYPATWQWLHDRVKPARDHNPRESRRKNWWLFGESQPRMRASVAGLPRYIATGQTAKHRLFQFLDGAILPDDKLIAIALGDAYCLGVLSSHVHVVWALAAGATLEDRPVYNKTSCFDAFPFPVATPTQQAHIRDLAEQIDAHRKRVLAAHDELTLTGLYNVLARVGAPQGLPSVAGDTANGTPLSAKEKLIHEKGLVAVLKSLHDELDAAVLDAYGWHDRPDEQTLLARLVALNLERRAEEAAGTIRWLRPEFQHPQALQAPIGLETGGAGRGMQKLDAATIPPTAARATAPQAWPQTLPEQLAAVARLLADSPATQTEAQLAASFTGKGRWKSRLPDILAALEALGRARRVEDGRWMG
ncbi:DNA methyltransferase [Sulfuritalea sp.]|uniref:class I SAM-dependent DNA methyltransferase n=1 Tax=Sulfuritalea sp. TaxID=2480090 RepID=UPI001AC06C26|nr:DNA methyltransferase [Sulfuritalea sp.]MBN8475170.1 class I SAM-dependent DNA methyltransferase [Sulfuritalea sp.]